MGSDKSSSHRYLQKTQRAMERDIIGVRRKEKVSNQELRQRTKTTDVVYLIKSKWSYDKREEREIGKKNNRVDTVWE